MDADVVLEGGGTKGPAHLGALQVFYEQGWRFRRFAGTSAGAIVAALLACGHSPDDVLKILHETNFRRFVDPRLFRGAWDTFFRFGLCRGDAFREWLVSLIGDVTMEECPLPLVVFAVDVANRETLRFDASTYPNMPVADAVRCSMSVPLFFRPVRWREADGTNRVVVDGGLTDNYPITAFDVPGRPRWPTIGLLLDEEPSAPRRFRTVVDYTLALLSLSRVAPQRRLSAHNAYRTVVIPDVGVHWLDFCLDDEEKSRLVESGRSAARAFLAEWHRKGGFEGYLRASGRVA